MTEQTAAPWDPKVEGKKVVDIARRLRLQFDSHLLRELFTVAAEMGLEDPSADLKKLSHIWQALNGNSGTVLESRMHLYAILHYIFGDLYNDGVYDPTRLPSRTLTTPRGPSGTISRAWSSLEYKQFVSEYTRILANHRTRLRKQMGLDDETTKLASVLAANQALSRPDITEVIQGLLDKDESVGDVATELVFAGIGLKLSGPIVKKLRVILQGMLLDERNEIIKAMTERIRELERANQTRHEEVVAWQQRVTELLQQHTSGQSSTDEMVVRQFIEMVRRSTADAASRDQLMRRYKDLFSLIQEVMYAEDKDLQALRDLLGGTLDNLPS